MRRLIAVLIGLGLVAVQGVSAQAPSRWSVELRADGAQPTRDLGPSELDTGVGFEATVRYRFLPRLDVYAGWDWVHFTASESFVGPDMDFEETGYAFGLRFERPVHNGSGTAAWIRAGGTVDHLEWEDDEGDVVGDTDHGLGWEVGAGLAFPIGRRWSLTPGLRYRSLSRDMEWSGGTTEVDLQYMTLGLGVVRRF